MYDPVSVSLVSGAAGVLRLRILSALGVFCVLGVWSQPLVLKFVI
jgi:hypothetical protein